MTIFFSLIQNKTYEILNKDNIFLREIIEKLPNGIMIISETHSNKNFNSKVLYYNYNCGQIFEFGKSLSENDLYINHKDKLEKYIYSNNYFPKSESSYGENGLETLYSDLIIKKNFCNFYRNENNTIYVKSTDIKVQDQVVKVLYINDCTDEKQILVDNIYKGLQSSLIITILHEINNPLNGLFHVIKEITIAVSEKKKFKLFDKLTVLKTFIKIFSENLNLFLKLYFNENLQISKQNLEFEYYFNKIYDKFIKIYKDKGIKLKLYKSYKKSNPILLYDFKYFKSLLSNIFILFYFISPKKSNVEITFKNTPNKIIIKFKNTQIVNRSNNNFYYLSDTDKSLIEHIENSIQTIAILKEIIIKLSQIMNIKLIIKERTEDIASINFELDINSFEECIFEDNDINEFSPSSQLNRKENVKKLKEIFKPNLSFFDKKEIFDTTNCRCNSMINDEISLKLDSSIGKNKSFPNLSILNNSTISFKFENKNNNPEENVENNILKPFMKQFQPIRLNINFNNNTLDTIRSIGNREDENKDSSPNKRSIKMKKEKSKGNRQILEIKKNLTETKLKFLNYEKKSKSHMFLNFGGYVLFPKKNENQNIDNRETKKHQTTSFLFNYETNKIETPFTRKFVSRLSFSCSCKEVLIVDDENFNIFAIRSLLFFFKVDTDECYNGNEFIEKLLKNQIKTCCNLQYRIVFLDLMMPVMGGFEAILKVQDLIKSNSLKFVPNIIIVSAHDTTTIKENIKNDNLVKDFVAKPVRKSKINELLSKYFFDNEL